MDIRQVIYKARQGNSVLFLGAGFSFEAEINFPEGFQMPLNYLLKYKES